MEQLLEMIREAGCVPVERDALYNIVNRWDVENPAPPPAVALPVLN
jgi:2-iminoacetate synthase ThiH